MKQIVPYKTLQGALNALDNAGRFYNVFTKAKDEVITDTELYKAAGVFSGKAQAFLFFELALSDLSETDRNQVIRCLSPELRTTYLRERPKHTEIAAFEHVVAETDPVIVAAYHGVKWEMSDKVAERKHNQAIEAKAIEAYIEAGQP